MIPTITSFFIRAIVKDELQCSHNIAKYINQSSLQIATIVL